MNYLLSTHWTAGEMTQAVLALEQYQADLVAADHPYSRMLDHDHAIANLTSGRLPAVIIGNYLLLYVVTEPWFSPTPVFSEVMLTKLPYRDDHAEFSEVVAVMEELAKAHGCSAVVTGNGYLRKGLTRLYEQRGFVPTNLELIKEIPHGWSC